MQLPFLKAKKFELCISGALEKVLEKGIKGEKNNT